MFSFFFTFFVFSCVFISQCVKNVIHNKIKVIKVQKQKHFRSLWELYFFGTLIGHFPVLLSCLTALSFSL